MTNPAIVIPAKAGISMGITGETPAGACPRMIESGAGVTNFSFMGITAQEGFVSGLVIA